MLKTLRRSATLVALLSAVLLAQGAAAPALPVEGTDGADLAHETRTLLLEEEKVWVDIYQRAGETIIFVSLHDNENTAAQAARAYLRSHGGRLVELRHGRGREVVIRRQGRLDRFDPNRMFTDAGLRRSLAYFRSYSDDNFAIASEFARQIATLIDVQADQVIVAVHNNTPGKLTILDFRPGQLYGDATQEVVVHPSADPDDFFFTNSEEAFRGLTRQGFNAALMKAQPPDIGTLGNLVNSAGGIFVLVEAEHGHLHEQLQMLEAVGQLAPDMVKSAHR